MLNLLKYGLLFSSSSWFLVTNFSRWMMPRDRRQHSHHVSETTGQSIHSTLGQRGNWPKFQVILSRIQEILKIQVIPFWAKRKNGLSDVFNTDCPPGNAETYASQAFGSWEAGRVTTIRICTPHAPQHSSHCSQSLFQPEGREPTKVSGWQPPGFLRPAGLDQWRLVSGEPEGWS